MRINNTNSCTPWQSALIHAQTLAARLPEMGLNPDKLAQLSLDELLGITAFLLRRNTEKFANVWG